MNARLGALVCSLITLVLFQNCAQNLAANGDSANTSEIRKVTEGTLLKSKTFYLSYDPSLLADRESLTRLGLKLDVSSGVISYLGTTDSRDGFLKAGDQFCLSAAERSEMEELLKQDSVCSGLNPLQPEDYCAMAMQLPYAMYGSDSQPLSEVGSARCLKAPDVDFCSGQGERVADLLDQVIQTLDQRSCKASNL